MANSRLSRKAISVTRKKINNTVVPSRKNSEEMGTRPRRDFALSGSQFGLSVTLREGSWNLAEE